ncbi:MAG: hypothetical protein JWP57_4003 [Spirosoma sp.]|nr:hypothetical protein [Spirosoma sp.]
MMSGNHADLRILVADDNHDTADSMTELLQLEGHQVRTVYDGEAAVSAAVQFVPHVAVLDIGMPYMNGYQVARALCARCPSTLLIAVSGWGTTRDVAAALEAGFHHHLTKPAKFCAILSLLDDVGRE